MGNAKGEARGLRADGQVTMILENQRWDFPGCPVVKTLCFHGFHCRALLSAYL